MGKQKKQAAPSDGPMVYTVPLELGDKKLTLEFNYRAYMAMHEYTGIDLLGEWNLTQLSSKDIACLLLAGTITHHPDLEFEWAIDQLRGRNTNVVLGALFDAYKRSLPEPDPEAKENPPKPVT